MQVSEHGTRFHVELGEARPSTAFTTVSIRKDTGCIFGETSRCFGGKQYGIGFRLPSRFQFEFRVWTRGCVGLGTLSRAPTTQVSGFPKDNRSCLNRRLETSLRVVKNMKIAPDFGSVGFRVASSSTSGAQPVPKSMVVWWKMPPPEFYTREEVRWKGTRTCCVRLLERTRSRDSRNLPAQACLLSSLCGALRFARGIPTTHGKGPAAARDSSLDYFQFTNLNPNSLGIFKRSFRRPQRLWLAQHAKGKSVLNLFAHAGGYSVAASRCRACIFRFCCCCCCCCI